MMPAAEPNFDRIKLCLNFGESLYFKIMCLKLKSRLFDENWEERNRAGRRKNGGGIPIPPIETMRVPPCFKMRSQYHLAAKHKSLVTMATGNLNVLFVFFPACYCFFYVIYGSYT